MSEQELKLEIDQLKARLQLLERTDSVSVESNTKGYSIGVKAHGEDIPALSAKVTSAFDELEKRFPPAFPRVA